MGRGRQAKVLTNAQIKFALQELSETRYPIRDKVMFLASCRAGLRAKEISRLTWDMVTNAEGVIGDYIALPDNASKGTSGRIIPMSKDLKRCLLDHYTHSKASIEERGYELSLSANIIKSERGEKMHANGVAHWFKRLYNDKLEFSGCSSHSGRRTAITRWAKGVSLVGGSLRDVQALSGHASLNMVQRYIEGDTDAQKKLVDMI